MHRSTWKKGESRIAKIFGTVRTPLSGGNSRHTMSDTLSERLYIEIKHLKVPPGNTLWQKTKKFSKKESKIPLIIFIKKNYPEPLILCKLSDIKNIVNEMKGGNEKNETSIEKRN